MLKFLFKLMIEWGRITNEKRAQKSKYKQEYPGRWVNKGKGKYAEDWQWEDSRDKVKNLRDYWVNVFKQGKNKYLIFVALEKSEFAVEYMSCESLKEVERIIRIYKAYYQVLGEVSVDNEFTSEDAQPEFL